MCLSTDSILYIISQCLSDADGKCKLSGLRYTCQTVNKESENSGQRINITACAACGHVESVYARLLRQEQRSCDTGAGRRIADWHSGSAVTC